MHTTKKAAYPTLPTSIIKHAQKHGFGDNYLRYLRKAANFNKKGHPDSVGSIAFSPQGDRIVSGSHDRTLRLWRGGTWRDWLHDCCNKLMFHSDLVSPKTDYARQACEVCKIQAWTRPETARFLRAQTHALERQGRREEAAAKIAEAERLEL